MSLTRLRKAVVFDRLVARLSEVASGRWVLKGALALDFRLGATSRTTKDMDLLRRDSEVEATEDFIRVQEADHEDFFVFSINLIERRDQLQEGGAVRYQARAELAGRVFEQVSVDVSFSDPLEWMPDKFVGMDLLGFAGIPPAEAPVLPLEQHVAEKVHAYTRTYGQGKRSSRPKDLVDLVLIKASASLDAKRLAQALGQTFTSRNTHEIPSKIPTPPDGWAQPYRRLAEDVGIDPDVEIGPQEAQEFLDPVLSDHASGTWHPEEKEWR
jgi:hypothetical protein